MGRVSRRKKSTRRQSPFATLMIMLAVVAICVVSIYVVSGLRTQSRELAITERSLEQKLAQAEVDRENLVAQEQYMKTNKYIEDEAKNKLGLVYPDEIVIKPAE